MPNTQNFKAFPNGTLKFLRGIRKNNTKTWFEAHRADYDDYYVAAGKQFVETIGPKLSKLSPQLVAEPRINGSIYRINRDVRFSKDKRPYKDHLDFTFWEGDKKTTASSLFFRVSPDGVFIGTGHHSCPHLLKALRGAVAGEDSGKRLAAVAKKLRKSGYELEGRHYKRPPRDLPADGPAAEFLLHNALYVVTEEKPAAASDPALIEVCLKHWKAAQPLHRWLIDHVHGTMG